MRASMCDAKFLSRPQGRIRRRASFTTLARLRSLTAGDQPTKWSLGTDVVRIVQVGGQDDLHRLVLRVAPQVCAC